MTTRQANELHVLSAGAAQGLVEALTPGFVEETGAVLRATFGAVGAIREKLFSGERCDALILTEAMIQELVSSGHVLSGVSASLGRVRTGIGIRSGDAVPDIKNRAALKRTLCAATDIYMPDPHRSTAGIHFARVLERLGIGAEISPRLRPHPNGATAMRELAQSIGTTPMGCTQMTEILYTAGVTLVGPLPSEFELATVYSVAVGSRAHRREGAERFAQLLSGAGTSQARVQAGFEI